MRRFTLGIIVLLVVAFVYFLTNFLVEGMRYYDYSLPLDALIPFVPFFVVFYMSYYGLLVLPLFVVKDIGSYVYGLAVLLLLSAFIFLFFPGDIPSTSFVITGLSTSMLHFIYTVDTLRHNVFPSMHVSLSFFHALLFHKWYVYLWVVLIALSTVLVKQHFVLDIYSGLVMGAIAYIVYQRYSE